MRDKSISLEIKLTQEDLYAFQKSIIARALTPASKAIMIIAMAIFALGILVSEVHMATKLLRLGLLFIIPMLIIVIIFWSLKRSSANAFKENKLVLQTQRFTITQEEIQVESDSGYSKIKWEQLYRAAEGKESFMLFISKQQAFVIPKRYLQSDAKQADLIRIFIKNAPVPKADKKLEKFYKYLLIGFIGFLAIMGIIVVAILVIL